jgi:cytochrome c-type biogenesis protein CcmH
MKPPRLLLALAALVCMGASAADPAARLHDPAQEARARSLFRQVRCLVCQNESIDESEADLADDLRKIVREQIASGRSDGQIRDYLVQRYGPFVLLKPPFDWDEAPLWLTPFVIVGVGGAVFAWRRNRPTPLEPPLSAAEQAELEALSATVPPQGGLTKGAQT